MGKWVNIAISGSEGNFPKLFFTPPDNSGDPNHRVLTIGQGGNVNRTTGNYGTPTTKNTTFFPIAHNLNLNTFSANRSITIGDGALTPSSPFSSSIYFFSTPSTNNLATLEDDFTFKVGTEGANANRKSVITHKGRSPFIIKITDSTFTTVTQETLPNNIRTPLDGWTNAQGLRLDAPTGQASTTDFGSPSNGTFSPLHLIYIFAEATAPPPDSIIKKFSFTYKRRVSTAAISRDVRISIFNPYTVELDEPYQNTEIGFQTDNSISNSSYGDPVVIEGTPAEWGITPQPGQDEVRFADVFGDGDPFLVLRVWVTGGSGAGGGAGTFFIQKNDNFDTPGISVEVDENDASAQLKTAVNLTGNNPFSLSFGETGTLFAPTLGFNTTSNDLVIALGGGTTPKEIGTPLASTPFGGGSTKKIKENIKDLDLNLLKNFNQLRPVSFNYIADPTKLHIGFIAEEVAQINPIFAKYGPNFRLNNEGFLDDSLPLINNQQVPLDISDRALLAASVAKLHQLDKKLTNLS